MNPRGVNWNEHFLQEEARWIYNLGLNDKLSYKPFLGQWSVMISLGCGFICMLIALSYLCFLFGGPFFLVYMWVLVSPRMEVFVGFVMPRHSSFSYLLFVSSGTLGSGDLKPHCTCLALVRWIHPLLVMLAPFFLSPRQDELCAALSASTWWHREGCCGVRK